MSDLIKQLVDHLVGETLIGGRKTGDMVVDGTTATEIEQFKTLLAEKLRAPSNAPAGASYLVYTGFLGQSGIDNPTVTEVGDNTIGAIVWERSSAGIYTGTLAGAFPANKCVFPPFDASAFVTVPVSVNAIGDFAYSLTRTSDDIVTLYFYDNTFTSVDISAASGGILLLVQINIHP